MKRETIERIIREEFARLSWADISISWSGGFPMVGIKILVPIGVNENTATGEARKNIRRTMAYLESVLVKGFSDAEASD